MSTEEAGSSSGGGHGGGPGGGGGSSPMANTYACNNRTCLRAAALQLNAALSTNVKAAHLVLVSACAAPELTEQCIPRRTSLCIR